MYSKVVGIYEKLCDFRNFDRSFAVSVDEKEVCKFSIQISRFCNDFQFGQIAYRIRKIVPQILTHT